MISSASSSGRSKMTLKAALTSSEASRGEPSSTAQTPRFSIVPAFVLSFYDISPEDIFSAGTAASSSDIISSSVGWLLPSVLPSLPTALRPSAEA